MKKTFTVFTLMLALMLSSFQQAQAAAPQWQFDQVHSGFHFDSRHIFSIVRGYFEEFSGDVRFDPTDLAGSKMDFDIKVDSILTNSRKRDNHLRSGDFFDSKKYPVISFRSSSITNEGGNLYAVAGKLTIKDVTKDIVLPVTLLGQKKNPTNPKEMVIGFESQVTLDRLAYHVGDGKFYALGVVQKDVGITFSLEMLRNN